MANLFLQFGSGPNLLPEPWRNHDKETDITQPLPFQDGEARFIVAEHVIEHVDFVAGLKFLTEAYRVLSVGGVLRLAFPDPVRLGTHGAAWFAELKRLGKVKAELELTPHQVPLLAAVGFGHRMAWTEGLAYQLLLGIGFRRVLPLAYGASQYAELTGVDGHHKTSSLECAKLETTVIEATK